MDPPSSLICPFPLAASHGCAATQVGDGGLPATLQLLHLFLEAPRWESTAMERAKQMYLSHFRSLPKSLERATGGFGGVGWGGEGGCVGWRGVGAMGRCQQDLEAGC